MSSNRKVRVPRDADGVAMHRAMGVPVLSQTVKIGSTSFVDLIDLSVHKDRVFIGLSVINPSSSSAIEFAFGEEGANEAAVICLAAGNLCFDNLTFGPGVVDDSTGKHASKLRARLLVAQGTPAQGSIVYSTNPTDGQTLVIGGLTYEFSGDRSVVPGRIKVDIGGTDDVTYTNLAAQINANDQRVSATLNSATNTVEIVSLYGGDYLESSYVLTDGGTGATLTQLAGGTGGVIPTIHIW